VMLAAGGHMYSTFILIVACMMQQVEKWCHQDICCLSHGGNMSHTNNMCTATTCILSFISSTVIGDIFVYTISYLNTFNDNLWS